MSNELFEQEPAVYVPFFLLSLAITVLAYGAFPFVFAKTRNSLITKKKYKLLCYGVNFIVMGTFIVINGGASNGAPYLLWTWIFSNCGVKILTTKELIMDSKYVYSEEPATSEPETEIETDKICFCRKCGEKLLDNSKFCRKCGTEIVE